MKWYATFRVDEALRLSAELESEQILISKTGSLQFTLINEIPADANRDPKLFLTCIYAHSLLICPAEQVATYVRSICDGGVFPPRAPIEWNHWTTSAEDDNEEEFETRITNSNHSSVVSALMSSSVLFLFMCFFQSEF